MSVSRHPAAMAARRRGTTCRAPTSGPLGNSTDAYPNQGLVGKSGWCLFRFTSQSRWEKSRQEWLLHPCVRSCGFTVGSLLAACEPMWRVPALPLGRRSAPVAHALFPTGCAPYPQRNPRGTKHRNQLQHRTSRHFFTLPTAPTTTAVFICSWKRDTVARSMPLLGIYAGEGSERWNSA